MLFDALPCHFLDLLHCSLRLQDVHFLLLLLLRVQFSQLAVNEPLRAHVFRVKHDIVGRLLGSAWFCGRWRLISIWWWVPMMILTH